MPEVGPAEPADLRDPVHQDGGQHLLAVPLGDQPLVRRRARPVVLPDRAERDPQRQVVVVGVVVRQYGFVGQLVHGDSTNRSRAAASSADPSVIIATTASRPVVVAGRVQIAGRVRAEPRPQPELADPRRVLRLQRQRVRNRPRRRVRRAHPECDRSRSSPQSHHIPGSTVAAPRPPPGPTGSRHHFVHQIRTRRSRRTDAVHSGSIGEPGWGVVRRAREGVGLVRVGRIGRTRGGGRASGRTRGSDGMAGVPRAHTRSAARTPEGQA